MHGQMLCGRNSMTGAPYERTHHLIPAFHHDIAYLRPESWYTETATRILDRAIAILEENREYTFTVEQAYFWDEYWKTHGSPLREILCWR